MCVRTETHTFLLVMSMVISEYRIYRIYTGPGTEIAVIIGSSLGTLFGVILILSILTTVTACAIISKKGQC